MYVSYRQIGSLQYQYFYFYFHLTRSNKSSCSLYCALKPALARGDFQDCGINPFWLPENLFLNGFLLIFIHIFFLDIYIPGNRQSASYDNSIPYFHSYGLKKAHCCVTGFLLLSIACPARMLTCATGLLQHEGK